jgi:hypothetical protein
MAFDAVATVAPDIAVVKYAGWVGPLGVWIDRRDEAPAAKEDEADPTLLQRAIERGVARVKAATEAGMKAGCMAFMPWV